MLDICFPSCERQSSLQDSSRNAHKCRIICQVCRHIEAEDACAWIPMRVRMMKGDFVVVDLLNSNPPVTDIVQVDIIRYPNKALVIVVQI
jgi:glycine cleavage system regulatory protein